MILNNKVKVNWEAIKAQQENKAEAGNEEKIQHIVSTHMMLERSAG